ncbi:hypothetical protein BC833DRAFT_286064 [Globomyces pollinis-pini]|nr:hypothetical protein BC833DRAFT_286064 [Globomyces pollinis-pini]
MEDREIHDCKWSTFKCSSTSCKDVGLCTVKYKEVSCAFALTKYQSNIHVTENLPPFKPNGIDDRLIAIATETIQNNPYIKPSNARYEILKRCKTERYTIVNTKKQIMSLIGRLKFENKPYMKSPNEGLIPNIAGAEAEFNQLCNNLKRPVQMVLKKDIIWSKKDPLHFWHSLAFTLRSEEHDCVAVTSFVDRQGKNKLYIASNDPMTASQQHEVTEIINLFLDLKPVNEIAAKLLPRHLSYIIKQLDNITTIQSQSFAAEVPGAVALSDKVIELRMKLNNVDIRAGETLSLEDISTLVNLITDNRKVLRAIKDGSTQDISEATRKLSFYLMKMVRLLEEVNFVWKKVQLHQKDESLKSLKRQFQFISFNCHAELAIIKIAKDHSISKTICIGVSKRPCYCCSLFFKVVEENKSTDFSISIVTTHGKLYGKWSKIENCFKKEFNQVWTKVIEDTTALKMQTPQQIDDDSMVSGIISDEDDLAKIRV